MLYNFLIVVYAMDKKSWSVCPWKQQGRSLPVEFRTWSRLLALLNTIRSSLESFVKDQHSSLFVQSLRDEEKQFYDIDFGMLRWIFTIQLLVWGHDIQHNDT
jgi:hypothetical protein